MEKETKRAFQRLLEIIEEQQKAIRALQASAMPSTSSSEDGLAKRIERIAAEIRDRESFEIDWRRMCDLHIAVKGAKGGEGTL
jgi:signal transduction histidine kinase